MEKQRGTKKGKNETQNERKAGVAMMVNSVLHPQTSRNHITCISFAARAPHEAGLRL